MAQALCGFKRKYRQDGRWLAGTVAGMFYAWALYRRGRVGDAIIAHATTNALIAADVLILGNWSLWN
jgi:uncharacterized membrane protein (UPF0136 family)